MLNAIQIIRVAFDLICIYTVKNFSSDNYENVALFWLCMKIFSSTYTGLSNFSYTVRYQIVNGTTFSYPFELIFTFYSFLPLPLASLTNPG